MLRAGPYYSTYSLKLIHKVILFSVWQYSIGIRLLFGHTRFENPSCQDGSAHEKRDGSGQVLGIASESTQCPLHGITRPSATRYRRESIYRLQRHVVVLHQRRNRREHETVGITEAISHHVQPRVLREFSRPAVSHYIL